MPSRSTLVCGLAAALAIAGCEAEVAPIEVGEGCPEQPLRGPTQFEDAPEQRLIDDFEHSNLTLPKLGGRNGFWVVGTEDTGARADARVSDRCAARGQRAAHFTGSGFSSWGVNWTALLRDQPAGKAVAYDATMYGGVSFWAATSADATEPFLLPVGVTTVDVAWNGDICEKCMDYYRSEVSVDRAWRRFMVRFDDLEQSGTGDPLIALRRDKLVGVIFWPDRDFDVWVDDVRLEP